MDLRHVSDGFHLDRKDSFGREASVPPWFPACSLAHFAIDTGGNGAGNGGNGYFDGSLIDSSYAAFEPLNMAQAGAHATASAHQTNIGIFDQAATQIAGIGGDGGDGHFSGTPVHTPVAVFDPVNIAGAAYHGIDDGHQSNTPQLHQGDSQ